MKAIFLQILDMSVSASILVAVVFVLRLVLKKAPKAIHCALWAMVALRLVCPSLPESQASLMPDSAPVTSVIQGEVEKAPVANVQNPAQNVQNQVQIPQATIPQSSVTVTEEPQESVDWVRILALAWLSGVGVMALYGVGSYLNLRRKVAPAIKADGVWLCDQVTSPFILGLFRPRIYLPSDLSPEFRGSVLAHERAHLRRKDHWWKPLGFALLAMHWFNPVMWLAYVLLCRDIEAACDERVVKTMEPGERKVYSEALLSCAASRRSIAACPLAFGEQGVKGRIKSVLSYKKPAVWIILAAAVAAIAVGVFFLTDPAKKGGSVGEIQGAGVVYFEIYDKEIWTAGQIPEVEEITRYTAVVSENELNALMGGMDEKDWKDFSRYDLIVAVKCKVTVVPDSKVFAPRVYYIGEGFGDILTLRDTKLFFSIPTQEEWNLLSGLRKRAIEGGESSWSDLSVMDMRIMDSDGCMTAIEKDCFYAIDSEGRFYRVYCDDMTGLQEWQLIRVTYRSDSYRELEYPGGYPDGGYTPQYEITAVKVEDQSSGEWVETMVIAKSRPSCLAFETDCFYAYDSNLNLCRIYCSDMSGLYEGQRIRVTYKEESRGNIEEPQPPGGWSPKYEVIAQTVYADGQTGLQENLVYFDLFDQVAWNGEIYKQTSTRYVVSVTEEEKQMLQAMPASQKWSNPANFSSPDFYNGSMTMLFDGEIERQ